MKEKPLGHDCEGTPIFKGDICARVKLLGSCRFEPGAFLLARRCILSIIIWEGYWNGHYGKNWVCHEKFVLRLGKPEHEII